MKTIKYYLRKCLRFFFPCCVDDPELDNVTFDFDPYEKNYNPYSSVLYSNQNKKQKTNMPYWRTNTPYIMGTNEL